MRATVFDGPGSSSSHFGVRGRDHVPRHGARRRATAVLLVRGAKRRGWSAFAYHDDSGRNLEHNFGHGRQNLSAVLTTLNLLAFACHIVCDLAIPLWRAAADKIGTRKRFFEHLRSITVFLVFPSWRDILETLAFVKAPPRPP